MDDYCNGCGDAAVPLTEIPKGKALCELCLYWESWYQ